MKLSTHLTAFLNELKKNHSQKTIQNYSFYLHRFLDWLGDKKPEAITEATVEKYQKWLGRLVDVHGDPLKKNTQNYHLIALRSFLTYLQAHNHKVVAPKTIKLTVMPARRVVMLDRGEVNRLLEAPLEPPARSNNANTIQHRDKALLEVLLATGLRVSDIATLTRENLMQKSTLSAQAEYWLKKYLSLRQDSNPHVFVSHDKRTTTTSLAPRSIQRIVQTYARRAGIKKPVTPHTLRHYHRYIYV